MRTGDRLVIFLDNMMPNFNSEYNFGHWPSKEIFDFKTWRENDCYMKIVKQNEDVDKDNVHGRYFMHDNF